MGVAVVTSGGTMQRILVTIAVTMTAATTALAQESGARRLGDPGTVAIGGERLVGVASAKLELSEKDNSDDTAEIEQTDVGLLITSNGRVAFDAFIAPSISLGGTVGYRAEDTEVTSDINDLGDDRSQTTKRVVVSPRAGYLHWTSPNFAIWPRAGFAYSTSETDISTDAGDGHSEQSAYFLTADVMGVIPIAPGAALTVGPGVGYVLGGSANANDEDLDIESGSELSLTAGILGWF
jgi:hypothetical protein